MGRDRQHLIALLPSGLVVLIFAIGVGFFYLFSPSATSLKTLKTQVAILENEIASINEEDLPQLKEKQLAFSNTGEDYQKFVEMILEAEKRIPAKEDFGSFVDQLFQAAKESEVDFLRVRCEGENELQDYSQLSVEIQVRADFLNLGEYLERIESMQRITTIDRFNINRVDYSSIIEAELFVSTYFVEE